MKTKYLYGLLLLVLLAACTDDNDDDINQPANEVRMSQNAFLPNNLIIVAGTTVRWVNNSNVDHTVTSDDNLFDEYLSSGDDFSYTFNETGTFGYICTIHDGMAGTIRVE